MSKAASKRRAAEAAGRRAEFFAEVILRLKGFGVLARRYKAPGGEIDLIVKRGNLVAFVEVKSRSTINDAIEAVSDLNARRISNAASIFLSRHHRLANCDMRYDIVAVSGWRWRHIPGAWIDDE